MFLLCTFAVIFCTTKISIVRGRTWCPWGTYGDECDKSCSKQCRTFNHRNTVHCHIESGLCSEGCIAGWYGDECNKACSTMCIQNVCNLQDGVCTQGCKDGKKGKFCEVEENEGKSKDQWTTLSIVLMVLLISLAFGSLVFAIVCWFKNRRGPSTEEDSDHETSSFI